MFKEHEQIVLTARVCGDEGEELHPGDIGTIMHVYAEEEAFVVESMAVGGETVAIATVLPSQARPVTSADPTLARILNTAV